MNLPIPLTFAPMEAQSVPELPAGAEWAYEPKWDGFRCLAFRDGDDVELRSKAGKPLTRYFPDIEQALLRLTARRFVLDGEIVIAHEGTLSFELLQQRIHPAASRVRTLAAATPALFVAFDLLLAHGGAPLVERPFTERRERLEHFAAQFFPAARDDGAVRLSPQTRDLAVARRWLQGGGDGLDGVVAKRWDLAYGSGERGMRKVKRLRTADCVVGGFRYATRERIVGSLLLGLYDEDGLLHHVGYTSSLNAELRRALTPELERLRAEPGFTGGRPGGPSRWSTDRTGDWVPLEPRLVCEVRYDHFSEGRFRHGTRFERWRPDKEPRQCTFEQIEPAGGTALRLL